MSTIRSATILALAAIHAASLAAQAPAAPQTRRLEIRVPGGAFLPSGSLRQELKDGRLTALQLSYVLRPTLAVTGTFGWTGSRDLASAGTPRVDVFTTDFGLEARPTVWGRGRVTFSPFVGAGAGARSYNYRSLDVDATHNLAGYVAAGGELGIRRVGLRVEVRDYVTGFKPLAGAGRGATRNDVMVMVGVRFNRRYAAQGI